MKLIVAVIRPEQFAEVADTLYRLHVQGISAARVKGHGAEPKQVESGSGATFKLGLSEKIRLEIAVTDPFVQPTIDAVIACARTGEVGDGKIFVLPLERVIRIRTGEENDAAVTPLGVSPNLGAVTDDRRKFKHKLDEDGDL